MTYNVFSGTLNPTHFTWEMLLLPPGKTLQFMKFLVLESCGVNCCNRTWPIDGMQ